MTSLSQNTSALNKIKQNNKCEKHSQVTFTLPEAFKQIKQAHPFYKELNYVNQRIITGSYINKCPENNVEISNALSQEPLCSGKENILKSQQEPYRTAYLGQIPRKYSAEQILL